MLLSLSGMLNSTDTKEQLQEFNSNPEKYYQYARDIEGELNKRFTLVSDTSARQNALQTDTD